MSRPFIIVSSLVVTGMFGCGGDSETGEGPGSGGAGGQPTCPPATWELPDGDCVPAGLPAAVPTVGVSTCAAGFTATDESTCDPILPAAMCPSGMMAVPGQADCQPVAICPTGTWEGIPIDDTTVFVDPAYAGGDSDGSQAQPYTDVTEAIAAAPAGGVVALAPAVYPGPIFVADHPVQLWGRCPQHVAIEPGGDPAAGLVVQGSGAAGTEIHRIGVRLVGIGLAVVETAKVVADTVWIHDMPAPPIFVDRGELILRRSLVERGFQAGLALYGAEVTVEDSVLRENRASGGHGLAARHDADTGLPSRVVVRGSVIEQNHEAGAMVIGSTLEIEGSVLRDNLPRASDGYGGSGVWLDDDLTQPQPAQLTLRTSVLSGNHGIGLAVGGGSLHAEDVVVANTLPLPVDGTMGRGVNVQLGFHTARPGDAVIRRSVVERAHELGIFVGAASAVVESTIVRDVLAEESGGAFGQGVVAAFHPATGLGAELDLSSSVVERVRTAGLLVTGSRATVEATVIRDVRAQSATGRFGSGVVIVGEASSDTDAVVAISHSEVRRVRNTGVIVIDGILTVDGTVIRDVRAQAFDGTNGDALVALSDQGDATVTATHVLLAFAERAGVASFSAAVSLGQSELQCHPVFLNGEQLGGGSYAFTDLGGNRCSCGGVEGTCKVLSSALTPPEPPPLPGTADPL